MKVYQFMDMTIGTEYEFELGPGFRVRYVMVASHQKSNRLRKT